jgi:exo-beta-1,3-glucanase (GH17 family)
VLFSYILNLIHHFAHCLPYHFALLAGLEHADMVSFNAYPGWYGGNASTIHGYWLQKAAWVRDTWPDKPFLISETGAGENGAQVKCANGAFF